MHLDGKNVLVTGSAVRVGREMALTVARAGGNVVLHYNRSAEQAEKTREDIEALGVKCRVLQADFSQPEQAAALIGQAEAEDQLFALVNSASIFQNLGLKESTLEAWQLHLDINLTSPFLLSQAFARAVQERESKGRIVNILDWRALRPGADHLPYTISKAGLAALTRSLAVALAPNITVNAMAFGAILPPSDGGNTDAIIEKVPAGRWAEMEEVGQSLLFLLAGPSYITGEIIHLDGGRHLI